MKRIALFIETASYYGRQILQGVACFRESHPELQWSTYVGQGDIGDAVPEWLLRWDGEGILTRKNLDIHRDHFARRGVAVVNLDDRVQGATFPGVFSDQKAIGRLAAESLLEAGYDEFGFAGFQGQYWSDLRHDGFAESIGKARPGSTIHRHDVTWCGDGVEEWLGELKKTQVWLQRVAHPIGIFCGNDLRGHQVLEAVRCAKLTCPSEVGVIAVDNDSAICDLSAPSLTSVVPDAVAIGFCAARLIERMMGGETVEKTMIEVPPVGVRHRDSITAYADFDEGVQQAMQMINDLAVRNGSVADIVRELNVSRRWLERKIREATGRSPVEQMRHVQLQHVKRLLATTAYSVEEIAHRSGFRNETYLYRIFKRDFGVSPAQYRQERLAAFE